MSHSNKYPMSIIFCVRIPGVQTLFTPSLLREIFISVRIHFGAEQSSKMCDKRYFDIGSK